MNLFKNLDQKSFTVGAGLTSLAVIVLLLLTGCTMALHLADDPDARPIACYECTIDAEPARHELDGALEEMAFRNTYKEPNEHLPDK